MYGTGSDDRTQFSRNGPTYQIFTNNRHEVITLRMSSENVRVRIYMSVNL